LTTTALATTAAAQGQGDACQRLAAIAEEQRDTFQEAWLTEADAAVTQAEPENCMRYVESAQAALDQGDAAERIEGRIVVTQPPADVAVQQAAPEVTVTQPDPQVTVSQQQPEIIVRQAPPTIRIEMPRPTVTIDQPDPEIIVNMPEPQVDVETAQAQVDVTQAEPRVQVEQPEPELNVRIDESGDQGGQDAQVQVQQQEAEVILQDRQGQDQADVQVQQQEPRVRFESAEPIIEFVEGGDPQVQVRRSGEQQASAGQQDETWRQGRESFAAPQVERDDYRQATSEEMSLANLLDADVFNTNDENIGTVSEVVLDPDTSARFVVVDFGTLLGDGSAPVALGFDEVTVLRDDGGDVRAYVDATRQELETAPRYQSQ
jgi:hypothetical protein